MAISIKGNAPYRAGQHGCQTRVANFLAKVPGGGTLTRRRANITAIPSFYETRAKVLIFSMGFAYKQIFNNGMGI